MIADCLKYLSPASWRRKPENYWPHFHPLMIGESGKNWSVSEIFEKPIVYSQQYPTIILEYMHVYRKRQLHGTIYWCPHCGRVLKDGPEGAGSVNIVCDNCNINFGNLDNSIYLPTTRVSSVPNAVVPTWVSPLILVRRRNPSVGLLNPEETPLPTTVEAIEIYLSDKFPLLRPNIHIVRRGNTIFVSRDQYIIRFWDKYGFLLGQISIVDHRVYMETFVRCHRHNVPADKMYDDTGRHIDLHDPQSLVKVDDFVYSLSSKHACGHFDLINTPSDAAFILCMRV